MKVLIISPHADDEVLGCFSFLKGAFVLYCGLDESLCPSDPKHRIPFEEKMKEIVKVSKFCDFDFDHADLMQVNKLYMYKYELIKEIEFQINHIKPDMMLIPMKGINQDHTTVNEACMVALRAHDKNHFVKKVLMYDSIEYMPWRANLTYFREVDVDKKIRTYKLYKSQVRKYRSPELVKNISRLLGSLCKKDYAEGFMVVRWVE